jgi:hypothetical protein
MNERIIENESFFSSEPDHESSTPGLDDAWQIDTGFVYRDPREEASKLRKELYWSRNTEEWQELRRKLFIERGGCCEYCGHEIIGVFNLHHVDYYHGDEPEYLKVVDRSCHSYLTYYGEEDGKKMILKSERWRLIGHLRRRILFLERPELFKTYSPSEEDWYNA